MLAKVRWKTAQYFELLWWKRYLRHKDTYEYLEWKRSYWHGIVDRLPQKVQYTLQQTQTILDAGCGPAGTYLVLDKHQVTAIDPLLDQYVTLPHFNANWYPNVKFINQALEDISHREEFDLIFCMNAINHVQDFEKVATNLHQALKPKGILVVTIDAHNYTALKQLFRLIPGDILHPVQNSLKGYIRGFEKAGFTPENQHIIKRERIFTHYLLTFEKN